MGDDHSLFNLPTSDQLLSLVPISHPGAIRDGEHFVQFYDNDYFLLDSITKYVSGGLQAGDACVVIATEEHRNALAANLMSRGLNVVNDGLGDRYFAYDAQKTLARFLIDDVIDAQLFRKFVGEIVAQAGRQGRHVLAFGEMVALLTRQGNYKAAIQLEQLWNKLQNKYKFALFCAYSLNSFSTENSKVLIDICRHHSQVIPAESYNILTNAEERLRAIVVLQQKAAALEKEIAERQKADQALQAVTDDLKRLLISEQLARAESEMANRMKDEFLATVSHELRTPLNAIIGWTHMLRIGKLDEEATDRAVETIERNAKAQAQLIEDILDVSRVITGKLQLQICRVDAASIINAAIDSVQPAADSKEIQIVVTLDPAIRHISGDANRLQQVIWNLLANAIKFTPPKGQVNVSLTRKRGEAQITVTDTGKGIDSAFLPFIFDRFRQADSSITRSFGGLGLGLSIVRHLVELHGGTVEARSDGEGKGATFIITLPNSLPQHSEVHQARIIKPSRWRNPPPEKDILNRSIADQRILLVDDDDDTLNLLAEVLREQGSVVEVAGSVREAIDVLDRFEADVIVSDLAMPEDDGYSLIQAIRAREIGERKLAQAIALTALVRIEDRARALSAGFNMFLPKPVQPNELISAIGNLTAAG